MTARLTDRATRRLAPTLLAALTLALAGCGGHGRSGDGPASGGSSGSQAGSTSGAERVTLRLKGAGVKTSASACGTTHRSARYAAATLVGFTGTVAPVPAGRWKVKVKVKVCRGGSFVPVAEVEATTDKKAGSFSGTLAKLPPGSYVARATLTVGATRAARSEKRHFAIG